MLKSIIAWPVLLLSLSLPSFASADHKHRLQPHLVELWTLDQSLSRPESVVYDERNDVLYVSNINGNPSEKDGNGYISTVSLDGDIIQQEWAPGLDAPKGMAIKGDFLYVADIDSLVEISLETGRVLNRYPGGEAQFLNDVAVDKAGNVYVSDSRQQTIYRLKDGSFDIWVDDERISEPNGIFARHGKLIVAAGDSSSERPGRSRFLQSIKFKNKKLKVLGDGEPIGSLDGVEKSGFGGYFLTDFRSGDIYHYTKSQGAELIASPEPGVADIDYVLDQQILYVPILNTGKLIAYKVLWCK